ncbi:mechanosensitive ion channel domain-containing protein [Flexithrix dorotheae]|uniref:mechanosensitive ion channel domain-containing protein n=1 Tax=Flexithrix dorotheae TaxID=70993 RepID=UPI000376790F|nr:mechanosensitive ion channel domain-containing protein [Flexithrix dorotheae]
MKNYLYLSATIIFLILIRANSAFSFQEVQQDTTKVIEENKNVIPGSAITLEAAETSNFIRKSAENIKQNNQIPVFVVLVDSLKRVKKEALDLEAADSVSNLSIRELDSKQKSWTLIGRKATDVQKMISSYIQKLEKEKEELTKVKNRWVETRNAYGEKELSEALAARLDTTLLEIDTLEQFENLKLDSTFKLLDELSQISIEVDNRINLYRDALIGNQGKLFQIQDVGFIEKFREPEDSISFRLQMKYYFKDSKAEFEKYYIVEKQLFEIHLIITLILLAITLTALFVQRKRAEEPKENYLRLFQKIVRRPFSTTIILSIFVAIFLYPSPPDLLLKAIAFLSVIPLVVILLKLFPKRYYPYILTLAGLYCLLIIDDMTIPGTRDSRILLFVMNVIEFVALSFFIFRKEGQNEKGAYRFYIIFSVYLHFLFSIVGLMANYLGATQLAKLITFSMVRIAYNGLAFYAGAIVVSSIFTILFRGGWIKVFNSIKNNNDIIVRKLASVTKLFFFILWMRSVLRIYGVETIFVEGFLEFFYTSYEFGTASISVANVFSFVFTIWLSVFITRIIRAILEDEILDRLTLPIGVPNTVSMMVRYSLITLGFFLAVAAAGIELTSLSIIFGAFSVGIGFGLQNIFNNLVSGIILAFERPIKLGDTVEVGNLIGTVKSMGMRSSNVRTFEGAEVIVPNGQLISKEVVNWTLSDQHRRIEIMVRVSHDSDPHEVYEILLKIISNHQFVLLNPNPGVYFQEITEDALHFRLLFWTSNFGEWIRIRSDIYFSIFDELKTRGVKVHFPQRELSIRTVETNGVQKIQKPMEEKTEKQKEEENE